MKSHLLRPLCWAGKKMARVAFTGHALIPGVRSSNQIGDSLGRVGVDWPGPDDHPGFIRWISFPVIPPAASSGRPVWVDFYVVPVYANRFHKAIKSGEAYSWVEAAAEHAIQEAKVDGVDIVVGWGAYTKMATEHGYLFANRRPEYINSPGVSTTHGDAGSAALTLEAVRLSGIARPRLAVIGAYGAIGGVVSRAAAVVDPEFVLLVGPPDKNGEIRKLDRLQEQKRVVEECVGSKYPVHINQDKATALLEHRVNVVIVATGGEMTLNPSEVPEGALVLDVATPPACFPHKDWINRLVLSAGCGQFADKNVIPEGFGTGIWDCGAGGDCVLWGCTGETIARAMFRWKGHLVGQNIPTEELHWCLKHFQEIGFVAQPPLSFGEKSAWDEVQEFCRKQK